MADGLKLDTEQVQQVANDMQRITRTLEDAAADSSSLAAVIPVHELSRAVEDFAGGWDDNRRSLVEEVSALREQAAAVAQAFTDVDSQLVDALTRPPQPEGGPGRPGRSDPRLSVFAHTTKGWMPWHPPLRLPFASPRVRYSASMTSRMRAAVSDGVFPTLTPAASRASFLACAVPAEPETIAPAWPIVLPSGAVKPAT